MSKVCLYKCFQCENVTIQVTIEHSYMSVCVDACTCIGIYSPIEMDNKPQMWSTCFVVSFVQSLGWPHSWVGTVFKFNSKASMYYGYNSIPEMIHFRSTYTLMCIMTLFLFVQCLKYMCWSQFSLSMFSCMSHWVSWQICGFLPLI